MTEQTRCKEAMEMLVRTPGWELLQERVTLKAEHRARQALQSRTLDELAESRGFVEGLYAAVRLASEMLAEYGGHE